MQDHPAESSSSSSSSQRGYGSIISIHNNEPPTTRRYRHVSMEGTSSTEADSIHNHSRKWMLWSLIALSIVLEVTYVLVRTQGGSETASLASFFPMLGSSSKHHHHPDLHDIVAPIFEGIHGFDESQMSWHPHAPTWVNNSMDVDVAAAADNSNHTQDFGWWTMNNNNNSSLSFSPPVEKDFWRYTYYEPTLLKDNGMYYAASIPKSAWPVTMTTYFELNGGAPQHAQFDQAGLYIRLDEQHWIKAGIEIVDDQPRLSCVVTNGYSDWSTQRIDNDAFGLWLRVHLLPAQGGSFVVQAKLSEDDDWTMIRIAHLEASFGVQEDDQRHLRHGHDHDDSVVSYAVGIFAASPTAAGSVATFSNFSILPGSDFVHEAS